MRIATYTRISTDEEHQPYSLDAQKTKLHAYIQSQDDWQLVKEYTDQCSGAKLDRPALQKALTEAKAGRFDLLLVYRVDRFSRSVRGLAQLLEELAQSGVAFRSSTEPFDTTTPAGRMMVQMLGVFAEFERATIIDRVINGMERKAARGEWMSGSGNRPFGYNVDKQSHQLQPNEHEAPLVKLMFEMYGRKDMGAQAIAHWLTERGHRTRHGKPWGSKTVLTILRNRVYIGDIFFRGQHHKASHDPLVEQELFERVERLLAQRGEDFAKRKSVGSDYLLTGLMLCNRCQKHFLGTAARGNRYRYRYYTCYSRNRYGNDICNIDRLPATDLEDAVLDAMLETFGRTDVLDEAIRAATSGTDVLRQQQQSELATVEAQIRKTEEGIDRYLQAFEEGNLPESVCGDRLRSLGQKAGELRFRRDELRDDLSVDEAATELDASQFGVVRQMIADSIHGDDDAAKKQLLQGLVQEIRIEGRDKIVPVFRMPNLPAGDQEEKVRAMGSWAVPTGHLTNHNVLVSGPRVQLKRRGE